MVDIGKFEDDNKMDCDILEDKDENIFDLVLNDYDTNKIKNNTSEFDIQNDSIDFCRKCKSDDIIQLDGYYTCKDCGYQLSIIIDETQEWRYYGQYDNKSSNPARCSMPVNELMPNISLGSVMANSMNETYGIRRIRKIQTWNSITYKESTLIKSFNNITNVSHINNINQCIIEEAKVMFKKVYEIKSYKKAKKNAMEAASLLLACKLKKCPRNSIEIAEMFGITIKDMRKGSKQFEELWTTINERERLEKKRKIGNNSNDNDNEEENYNEHNYGPNNSIAYLHRSCSKLNLSDDVFNVCKNVCEYIEEFKFLIKHIPLSRTAGCIYFTCYILNIDIEKYNISKVCLVSEVTINKCFQVLYKSKDEIIKNTLLYNYIKL